MRVLLLLLSLPAATPAGSPETLLRREIAQTALAQVRPTGMRDPATRTINIGYVGNRSKYLVAPIEGNQPLPGKNMWALLSRLSCGSFPTG